MWSGDDSQQHRKLIDRSVDVNAIYDIELFIFFIRNAIEILISPKSIKPLPIQKVMAIIPVNKSDMIM